MKTIDLKTRRPGRERTLAELIDREHKRIAKLTKQRDQASRRLARARMRYSVLNRMAADELKRGLGGAP